MTTPRFDMQRALARMESWRSSYLEDLRSIVDIDSGTFDKAGIDRVVDVLETWYSDLGARVERRREETYGDMLTATLRGSGAGSLLLIGHTDTVYPAGTVSERPMDIRGDRVTGPGTADMKGGDLSIVYALRALMDQGSEHFGEVVVLHNSEEEIGSPASRGLVAELAGRAGAVLVLEAGRENGDVVLARKGIADIEVWVTGRAAHAGVNHDQGRSAILALARLVEDAEALNGTWPDVTVNVGVVEGGDRVNVVPDHAYARLEVRAFKRELLEDAIQRIRAIADRQLVDGTETRVKVSVEHWPMHRSEGGDRLFALATALASEVGITFSGASTGGASDGNTAAGVGRPVLDGLGPVGGRAHSPDEYIELSSIVPRTVLLAGLIAAHGDPALRDAEIT